MKTTKTTTPLEHNYVTQELDARACEQALWIGLLMAQRVGWTDIVANITLMHATVLDRRRTLEALSHVG